MGGGLLQLVAYGAQDVYLTGNPQITFFKVVYRRHTNFAIESIEQTFNGAADFGRRVTCTISRNGDLIHRMYLQVDLPALTGSNGPSWVDFVGLAMIKNVEIEIGGQRIDKMYGDWMYIWNELTQTAGKKDGYARMVGESVTAATTLWVPLQFWFCRNPGLALPLIALQYHEVRVNIEFRAASELVKVDSGNLPTPVMGSAALWVDYIFLDTDERRRFAQLSHEYLIEQLQFTGDESVNSSSPKIKLSFNHPCKELVWVVQHESEVDDKNYFSYSKLGVNPIARAKLQLNGHDRFAERPGEYFSMVQPFQHHENVPTSAAAGADKGINVYSFGLKPEEHQPSGTINMSRIDTATLQMELKSGFLDSGSAKVRVYALSYNVLRVMSGMGGLAFSS